MKKILLSAISIISCIFTLNAQVQLSPLFSDNMVLQQQSQVPLWGKAKAGMIVKIKTSWDSKEYVCKADRDGKWQASITTSEAGGPYEISFTTGKLSQTLKNVMCGDVWLCSGQSNMEMPVRGWGCVNDYEKELADAGNYPLLRILNIQKASSYSPLENFRVVGDGDGWEVSGEDAIEQFSACGYFFGREIQKSTGVPIGLISAAYGGSCVESWMSEDAIAQIPGLKAFVEKREEVKRRGINLDSLSAKWVEAILRADAGAEAGKPVWAQAGFDDSEWSSMEVPGNISKVGLGAWDGVLWYRHEVDIPASWAGKDLIFNLQNVDDDDWTYFNGELIGKTEGFNVYRRYIIPGKYVKEGKNLLSIRLVDLRQDAGLLGEAQKLTLACGEEKINISGKWKYRIGSSQSDIDEMPQLVVRRKDYPGNHYNAMIKPIIPFAIKGVIWYQGETNTSAAYQYRETFPVMIENWRRLWGRDFPFYIVQLANFHKKQSSADEHSAWAELREAQAMTASCVKDAHYCVTLDIGDAEDIHPKNKQEVGRRLALLAGKYSYGQSDLCAASPEMCSYFLEGSSVRINFKNTKILRTMDGSSAVKGFVLAGGDHKFYFADARIEGSSVIVSCPQVPFPLAVRYAWADNPDCNLCGENGLPVGSFRTDQWPGVTFGVDFK